MEHACTEPAIVFAWDGVGYGGDGSLWGGETFVGRPGAWQRRASLRSFRLPGGDKAGRSPWRSAAALCWEAGVECPVTIPDPIVRTAWERGVNAPRSSAAGRVFDALAAIVLGTVETSFEGQGPMCLEACARPVAEFPSLPIGADDEGLLRIDWAPLLEYCADQRRSAADRAGAVHAALADAIGRVAEAEHSRSGATCRRSDRWGVPEPPAARVGGGPAGAARLPGAAAGANSLQRRRPELRAGGRTSRVHGRRGTLIINRCERYGYTATMLWFERPFLHVLRREYAGAMRFDEDDAAEVMPAAPAAPCQLYVHVPFCEVLCPFCSFHRVRYNESKTARYFKALRREIQLYHAAGFRFRDVYVGGGTPTVHPDELLETLGLIRSLSPVRTVSIETNPNHLEPDVLARYRDAGVTRFSVGVQSFDDGLLAGMDRLEKYGNGVQIRDRLAAVRGIFRRSTST
jgi:hypothetical protein